MGEESIGEILRVLDGVRRDVGDAARDSKSALDQLKKLNGQVADHTQWIAIRTDREQQADERGDNRSSWLKVGISTVVLGGVAMIGLLIQIATSAH